MSLAKRGVPKTKEHRRKLASALGGRPFVDDLGQEYQTIPEAGVKLGIAHQNIWKVLKGRRSSAGGRSFKYL